MGEHDDILDEIIQWVKDNINRTENFDRPYLEYDWVDPWELISKLTDIKERFK